MEHVNLFKTKFSLFSKINQEWHHHIQQHIHHRYRNPPLRSAENMRMFAQMLDLSWKLSLRFCSNCNQDQQHNCWTKKREIGNYIEGLRFDCWWSAHKMSPWLPWLKIKGALSWLQQSRLTVIVCLWPHWFNWKGWWSFTKTK